MLVIVDIDGTIADTRERAMKYLESAGEPSTCSYAFDCIICDHSVPVNSIRQPVVPICQECREALREIVAKERAQKEASNG